MSRHVLSSRRRPREHSPSPSSAPPPKRRQRSAEVSPDTSLRHPHHRRSGKKAAAENASSSSVLLFERQIHKIEQGMIKDGFRVGEEKAKAVWKLMTKEERELAEKARGTEMVILDDQGRRYSVFYRRRSSVGDNFLICDGGWTLFAENHHLHPGDTLRFFSCRALPRESSGKLYIGVRVVKHQPVVAAAAPVAAPAAPAVASKFRSPAAAALAAFFVAPSPPPAVGAAGGPQK